MASFAATGDVFDALVVWLCGWGRGDPSRTNLGNSPTSLPSLQVLLGTLGPMHRMISDFFPSLVTCSPCSAIHHFCFFSLHFLSCCTLSAVFPPSHPWFCQDSSPAASFLFFTSVSPPLFYFCPTKHVSMSPCLLKNRKEIKSYM